MAGIARKTKRHPTDLTDEEWERLAPLMPRPGRMGRPREIEFREVINAVRYLVRAGCGWRMLPWITGTGLRGLRGQDTGLRGQDTD
jgi:transposase